MQLKFPVLLIAAATFVSIGQFRPVQAQSQTEATCSEQQDALFEECMEDVLGDAAKNTAAGAAGAAISGCAELTLGTCAGAVGGAAGLGTLGIGLIECLDEAYWSHECEEPSENTTKSQDDGNEVPNQSYDPYFYDDW